MSDTVIVRFAPSPTGYLHVGGARTAIFNWLYARSVGGRFYLRIEDTDRSRSSGEMTREIFDGLRWLGIDWDEKPWIQSESAGRHREECLRLLDEGKAYHCYCTPEELEAKRKIAEANGSDYRYDRTCLRLSEEERQRNEETGKSHTLRFLVPEGSTHFFDIVHGEVTFSNEEIDDMILLRSDGSPVYMVAVVVDDHDMRITRVLRGDDHLSNTPKQILLYKAFGYELPMFGHMPLILGPDKSRLSKRHGATAVGEYQNMGYLPEAVFNYLSLLGWSPGKNREIMSGPELLELFSIQRLSKSSAVFDEDKLRWLNGQYIRNLEDEEFLHRLKPFIPPERSGVDETYLRAIVPLMKERITLLPEFFENTVYFFEDPLIYEEKGVKKHWKDKTSEQLRMLSAELEAVDFGPDLLETLIREKAEEFEVSASKLIHPLRIALTGGSSSPGLFEMMSVLGKETCLRRIESALKMLG